MNRRGTDNTVVKRLTITKGYPEAINRRKTMIDIKRNKLQATVEKTVHKKTLKIEKNKSRKKSGGREIAPLGRVTDVILLLRKNHQYISLLLWYTN